MIDWSRCQDVESDPARCGGAWCVRGTRVMAQGILDNAEAGCTPEEIAHDIFPTATVEQARRILRFAFRAELKFLTDARRKWPSLPADYQRRADVLTRKLAELDLS
jgi:uncharacterized protein (DUF433 family)